MEDDEKDEMDELLNDPDPEDTGDDDMKAEKPKEPKPPEKPKFSCKECGKGGIPLIFTDGEFYCTEHTPKPVVVAPPPPATPAPLVIPWHRYGIQNFDVMRKKIMGTNQLVEMVDNLGSDEVQMETGDRIVVMVIMKGEKHKVFDKTVEQCVLSLFNFTLTRYGPCTLSPHMTKKNLTPPGYT